MKKVFFALIVFLGASSAFANPAAGRCFATPLTPPTQAQFCYIASEENCNAIGCEWRHLRYRCQPGPQTPARNAPFCATASQENCEIIGCELTPYYTP